MWWRCHGALVADYPKAAGVTVYHIMSEAVAKPHPYTSAAQFVGNNLSYH